jgi:hypothetical protein
VRREVVPYIVFVAVDHAVAVITFVVQAYATHTALHAAFMKVDRLRVVRMFRRVDVIADVHHVRIGDWLNEEVNVCARECWAYRVAHMTVQCSIVATKVSTCSVWVTQFEQHIRTGGVLIERNAVGTR